MSDDAKTVYIVTTGSYSDYSINSVWSDQGAAVAYVDRLRRAGANDADMAEYEVDEIKVIRPGENIVFRVSYIERPSFMGDHWYETGFAEMTELPAEDICTDRSPGWWYTWVWARDGRDALKKGADKIMPALADAQIEGVVSPERERGWDRADTPFLDIITNKKVIIPAKQEWGFSVRIGDDEQDREIVWVKDEG